VLSLCFFSLPWVMVMRSLEKVRAGKVKACPALVHDWGPSFTRSGWAPSKAMVTAVIDSANRAVVGCTRLIESAV